MPSETSDELIVDIARLRVDNETLRRQAKEALGRVVEQEQRLQLLDASEQGEAEHKTRDAIDALDVARGAIDFLEVAGAEADSFKFVTAGKLIAAGGSENAATAHTCIMRAYDLYPEAEEEVKAAQRAVRDVLVVRFCAQAGPRDRTAFLEAAAEAFGFPADREVKNLLLLAYSKLFKNKSDKFLPNTARLTARRGRPRPRRNRGRVPAWVQIPEWALGRIDKSSYVRREW